jgi:lipocalin
MRLGPVLLFLGVLAGCTAVPTGVEPVRGFDLERYLGTWHEIARLDHSFERGLTNVTATYAKTDDGASASSTGASIRSRASGGRPRVVPTFSKGQTLPA